MANAWKLINAPLEVSVTAANLAAAINSYPSGTVLVVEEAGAPLNLTVSRKVEGYGICVKLPLDQLIWAKFTTGGGGVHFFGGKFSADGVAGNFALGNFGLNAGAGSSGISAHGSIFEGNENAIYSTSASDMWFNKCLFEVNRADVMQIISSSRVVLEQSESGLGARGRTLCYFDDGRLPQNGMIEASCVSAGGTWVDGPHSDLWQIRDNSTDLAAKDNHFRIYGAMGFTTFGTSSGSAQRIVVSGNRIENAISWGMSLNGSDFDIQDNTVTAAATAPSAPILKASRTTGGRIKGGRNTAPAFDNPSGVDLASQTINGDSGVVAPEAPRITLPPWAPDAPLPAPKPIAAPKHYAGGGFRYSGTLAAGTWLTLEVGIFSDFTDGPFEFRWYVDDVLVPEATSQVFQAISGTIRAEARAQNSQGWGPWASLPSVVVA